MVELHKNSELNLQNIGFTYPEDHDTSSLEQLKEHENRLSQTKDALLGQQIRLKKILQNVKVLKGNHNLKYFLFSFFRMHCKDF